MEHGIIRETLTGLLEHLHLPFSDIQVSDDDGFVRIDIESPSASQLIGWHGETLNALQHMLKAIMRTKAALDRSPFLVLDIDGYRRDQEEKVRQAALRKAEFVRRTGNRVALPPMNPYFRRIVHVFVANAPDMQDLTTASTGEGDYRQIVLRLKEENNMQGDGEGELSPVLAEDSDDNGLENLDV